MDMTTLQSRYHEARFRSEYHTWSAIRGHVSAGNDPVDGRAKGTINTLWRGEGRAVNIAAAKYWLGVARQIRQSLS